MAAPEQELSLVYSACCRRLRQGRAAIGMAVSPPPLVMRQRAAFQTTTIPSRRSHSEKVIRGPPRTTMWLDGVKHWADWKEPVRPCRTWTVKDSVIATSRQTSSNPSTDASPRPRGGIPDVASDEVPRRTSQHNCARPSNAPCTRPGVVGFFHAQVRLTDDCVEVSIGKSQSVEARGR